MFVLGSRVQTVRALQISVAPSKKNKCNAEMAEHEKQMKSDLLFAMLLIPRKMMADQVSQHYPNNVQTLCHDDNVLETLESKSQ